MIQTSEVHILKNLVDYQDGTIVSKTVIDKKVGTVTIFAFDKNQGLSEHTAPFDALVIILDGSAEITISKNKYMLEKGQMIVMPSNTPHALKALNKFKMLLIMIKS